VSQIIESKDGNFDFDPKGFKYDGNTVINVTENLLNQNEELVPFWKIKRYTLV
jgi:hypothetical protein